MFTASRRSLFVQTVWFVQTIKMLRSGVISLFIVQTVFTNWLPRHSAIDFWRKLDYYLNCITLSMLIFRIDDL